MAATSTGSMRAIVLEAPGRRRRSRSGAFRCPGPAAGWVLIAVQGVRAQPVGAAHPARAGRGVTFPRVLGDRGHRRGGRVPGREFPVGQQVVAMMGGMGRTFDGGYAEYTCVPARQVIPFRASWTGRRSARCRDAADGVRLA